MRSQVNFGAANEIIVLVPHESGGRGVLCGQLFFNAQSSKDENGDVIVLAECNRRLRGLFGSWSCGEQSFEAVEAIQFS